MSSTGGKFCVCLSLALSPPIFFCQWWKSHVVLLKDGLCVLLLDCFAFLVVIIFSA